MLSPSCEQCGCALSAVSGADWTAADAGPILGPVLVGHRILRLVAILGAALVALAALRTGYALGGPAVAVAAVGIAGLVVGRRRVGEWTHRGVQFGAERPIRGP